MILISINHTVSSLATFNHILVELNVMQMPPSRCHCHCHDINALCRVPTVGEESTIDLPVVLRRHVLPVLPRGAWSAAFFLVGILVFVVFIVEDHSISSMPPSIRGEALSLAHCGQLSSHHRIVP